MEPAKPVRELKDAQEVLARLDKAKNRPEGYREALRAKVAEWAKTQPNGGVGVKSELRAVRRR
jgi:hypothetical protein